MSFYFNGKPLTVMFQEKGIISKVKWTIATIASTICAYILILYGSVYYEVAERANEATWLYQLLVYAGWVLAWPIAIYGWLRSFVSDSNMLGMEVWFIQFGGYALLYLLYAKLQNKIRLWSRRF